MKSKIILLGLFLLVWGCPNNEHDHDHDEHDAGHAHHDDPHNETTDAGTVNEVTDAGTTAFELPAGDAEVITLAGEHSDDYSNHVVTTTGWFMYGLSDDSVSEFKILTYSNREKYAIAMNSPDNAYNPGAYSRFDWTIDTDSVVHYCQTRYDAASAQEAYETAASDSSDLAAGCGNFSWTALSATALDLVGTYADSWGTAHEVTSTTWAQTSSWTEDGGMVSDTSEFTFLYHSNEQQWLIAKNSESNAYSAGLFSRFDWVTVADQLYFCQTAYDAATAREALELAAADASDPATGGCGFSTWSSITAEN